ncbi:MAG TPA: AsmA family protein [Desulfuromonadaceae bacterium]
MNKALKITGIVGAVIVALLIGIFALAKIIITPERVKKTVVPLVEKKLHRQVQLGEIKVSIFSGIVVKGLTIMEKEGGQAFVRAELVKLSYQFWPLLSKRIVVDEIRLDSPRIRVVRLPDGSFNYSDIMAKKEPTPEEKAAAKGDINLLVTKVALSRGELVFEDQAAKTDKPFIYAVSGIEVIANNIALDKSFPFNVKAKLPGAALELDGKLANIAAKPVLDAELRITEADVKKMMTGLPPALVAKAKPYDPAGKVNVKLTLAGAVATLKDLPKEGEIRLDNLQVTVSGARLALAGKLALKGGALSSQDLVLSSGENKLQIALNISNLFSKPIVVTSSVKAERFDLDPFLKKGAKTAPSAADSAVKPEPGPLKIPVRATGTVQLGQTSYKGLPVTQLLLKYRLIDNILTIDQLTGSLAGGSFADTARIDLTQTGFAYSTRLKVQGVQANQVVSAFAPKAAGTVFGTMALNAELNGRGTQPALLKKNLTGKGDFTISEGRLTGSGLVQGLARFVNLDQLRDLRFNRFAGTFQIQNGKIILDSDVSGKDIQITPKGTAGLDKSLNISLVTRLSPELSGKVTRGDIGKLLTDEKGWGVLPVKVEGTTSSPKFRLDPSAVKEQMKTKAREKLQQTIEEKFLKKKQGEPKRPEQDLIERGLKGIFGK